MLQTSFEPNATLIGVVVGAIAVVGVLAYRYASGKQLADEDEIEIARNVLQDIVEGNRSLALEEASKIEGQIRDVIKASSKVPTPETKSIEKSAAKSILKNEVNGYNGSAAPIRAIFTDEIYFAPKTKDDMEKAKSFNIFRFLPYRPEVFDSEDFASAYSAAAAFVFGTNSIATVYDDTSDKYYNIILYANAEVEYYDPKSSEVIDPEENEEFDPESGLILL
jgi:hypothetical protein